jgi:hypothetical protein
MGCALIAAAVMKGRQLHTALGPIADGLIHNRVLVAGLSEVELLLGLWMVVGGVSRLRHAIAIIWFCLLAIVATIESIHAIPSCGCFGSVRILPALTATFDVSAVVALWLTRSVGTRQTCSSGRIRLSIGILLAVSASAALWIAFYFGRPAAVPGDHLVILDPGSWLNQEFPLFDEINGSAPLQSGQWRMIFYHYDCPDCVDAIDLYRAKPANGGVRTAFVAVPPLPPPGADPVPDAPGYLHLQLSPDHEWFVTTPLVIVLKDGIVRRIGDK